MNTTVSLCFHDGAYVIQAPIGVGKSFLFFDGPLFALYKTGSRQLLSAKAEEGSMQILFEHDGIIMSCVRDITRTKAGNDAVKSSLYLVKEVSRVDLEGYMSTVPVVSYGIDIFDDIKKQGVRETLSYKNESDVQTILRPFLPPEEVFLTTSMLLQDSKNVFESTPSERISILKEIFGLVHIDSATEKIADEKKIVAGMIKSKASTEDQDRLLREHIHHIRTATTPLISDYQHLSRYTKERELIEDNVTLIGFERTRDFSQEIESIGKKAQEDRDIHQQFLGTLHAQKAARILQRKQLDEMKTKCANIQQRIQDYEQEKNSITQTNQSALSRENRVLHTISLEWIASLSQESTQESTQKTTVISQDMIETFRAQYQAFFHEGKELHERIQHAISLQEQYKQRIEEDAQTLTGYTEQLAILQQDYIAKEQFHCSHIQGYCPLIKDINKNVFSLLDKQIAEQAQRKKTYEDIILQKNLHHLWQEQKQYIASMEAQRDAMRNHIRYKEKNDIDAIKKSYDAWIKNERMQKEHSEKIAALHTHIRLLTEQEKDLLHTIELEEKTYTQKNDLQEEQQEQHITMLVKQAGEKIALCQELFQYCDRIEQLIKTHKNAQRVLKELREKDMLLQDLYRIFSKEIMIQVLEEALPLFATYINTILEKIVSFSVHFIPKKTSTDKIELEITIRDTLGERNVKSLSGGQKAILRLSWILAVAQMMRTSQVFLDETINNIDRETIGTVADMLEDRRKMTGITLYVVTHSSQLQNLGIRNESIHIEKHNTI